jgi:hypothetical protein
MYQSYFDHENSEFLMEIGENNFIILIKGDENFYLWFYYPTP